MSDQRRRSRSARQAVSWRTVNRVATIRLAAANGNFLDLPTAQQLCATVDAIRDEGKAAVVLLVCSGRDFCLGADAAAASAAATDWATALAGLEQPLVAAVQGRALEGGAELALLADLRIAARGARWRFDHVAQGALPRFGASQRLPRLIGRARALDLLMSGRWLAGAEAERTGLVARRVEAGQLGRAASQLAKELAGKGPQALRYAKEAVLAGSEMTLSQGIGLEQDLYVLLQTTADRREGIESFLGKRRPRYRGV